MRNKKVYNILRTSLGLNPYRSLPKVCGIKLTDRCNLRCRHCNLYYRKSSEMNTDNIFHLLDVLQKLSFSEVVFAGGEPFLRKDFINLVDCAIGKNLKVHICTNGSLLNEKIVKKLMAWGVIFWLSLDGSTPEIHDKIRGREGNWVQVLKVMNWLNDFDYPILIKNVIMKENIDDQINLVNFLKQFKNVELRHDPANVMRLEKSCYANGVIRLANGKYVWSDYQDSSICDRACEVIDKLSDLQKRGEEILKTPPSYWNGIKCYIRNTLDRQYLCDLNKLNSVPINANGDVSLCGTWISGEYIIGNVVAQNFDLKTLWNSRSAWHARKRSLTCTTPCWIDDRFSCKIALKNAT